MGRAKLATKAVLIIALFIVPLFAGFTFFTATERRRSIMRGLDREIDTVSALLPTTLIQPMMESDWKQVRFMIWSIVENETILGAKVSSGDRIVGEHFDVGVDESAALKRTLPIIMDDGINEPVELGSVELVFTEEIVKTEIRRDIRNSILEGIVVLAAIMVLLFFLLSRVVVRPVKAASGGMQEIAEGEADLRNRLKIRSRDELGELADHFNVFVANLDSLMSDIRRSLDLTLVSQMELGANTEESAAAASEMAANIESAKQQITLLGETVTRSVSTIEQIVRQIQVTINHVASQGTMVEETVSAVTELLASIESVSSVTDKEKKATEKLVTSAEIGGDKISQTNATVEEITSSIEEIEQLLTIINSIASQTNLLAMNAAIEAAHAGESGKGFAVVADEIRKLAESSSMNAENIGGVLTDIITRIETASKATHETMNAFGEIQGEIVSVAHSLDEISMSMTEMSTGSREIHQAMGDLQDVSSSLVDNSHTMEEGTKDLSSAIERIRDISQVVSGAMEEIHSGIMEINKSVSQVTDINGRLEENARDLGAKLSRFRTTQKG